MFLRPTSLANGFFSSKSINFITVNCREKPNDSLCVHKTRKKQYVSRYNNIHFGIHLSVGTSVETIELPELTTRQFVKETSNTEIQHGLSSTIFVRLIKQK